MEEGFASLGCRRGARTAEAGGDSCAARLVCPKPWALLCQIHSNTAGARRVWDSLDPLARAMAFGDDHRQFVGGEPTTRQSKGEGRGQVVEREHRLLCPAVDFLLEPGRRRRDDQGHGTVPGIPAAHPLAGLAAVALDRDGYPVALPMSLQDAFLKIELAPRAAAFVDPDPVVPSDALRCLRPIAAARGGSASLEPPSRRGSRSSSAASSRPCSEPAAHRPPSSRLCLTGRSNGLRPIGNRAL